MDDALEKFCSTAAPIKGKNNKITLDQKSPHDKEWFADDEAGELIKSHREVVKQELKDFAIEILINDYEYSEADARGIVDQSSFSKVLDLDFEYACHADVRDWVVGMLTERGGRDIITSRMYRNALDYARFYAGNREDLIQRQMTDHGLSRESAERSIRYADSIYQDYLFMIKKYETEND